jgi:glycosyltransferase involved in cell wall biosynthesis
MRIAFFGDAKYIGAYEWIRFLADQSDFEVHAIVFPGHEREIPRVRMHVLSDLVPGGKLRYILCAPALRRVLRGISPDLLIAYRVVSYGFAAALSGFHPVVMAAQGMFISSRATPKATRFFARRAVRAADLLHSWAPVMTGNMIALGADRRKIMELTRGVDDEAYSPGVVPPPPLTLVTTRQLEKYYNFPTLLHAARSVRDAVGQVRYRIAGEGSERPALEQLARELGIGGDVEFLGSVARDRLPDVVRSAHLYVAAVPSDGTSSSLLEAMAAGVVPIVADNESNRHWIRDGEGGRLVASFDSDAYASAIVDAWRSEEWRSRARRLNRDVIEDRASWRRNMQRFASAYRDLVERSGSPVTIVERGADAIGE